MAGKGTDDEHIIEGLAFTELVMFIEEAYMDDETSPVFKLVKLTVIKFNAMEKLGVKQDFRMYTTCFKQRLLVIYWPSTEPSIKRCTCVNKLESSQRKQVGIKQ